MYQGGGVHGPASAIAQRPVFAIARFVTKAVDDTAWIEIPTANRRNCPAVSA
jgi:hypothetical protein